MGCFNYFCRACWELQHGTGLPHHRPIMRNTRGGGNMDRSSLASTFERLFRCLLVVWPRTSDSKCTFKPSEIVFMVRPVEPVMGIFSTPVYWSPSLMKTLKYVKTPIWIFLRCWLFLKGLMYLSNIILHAISTQWISTWRFRSQFHTFCTVFEPGS